MNDLSNEVWSAFQKLIVAYAGQKVELHLESAKTGVLSFTAVYNDHGQFNCAAEKEPMAAVLRLVTTCKPITPQAAAQKKINALHEEIKKLESELDPLVGQVALAQAAGFVRPA